MIIRRCIAFISRIATQRDRDKLDNKFEKLDERLDKTELKVEGIASSIKAMHELNLANNEVLETKLNSTRAGQESIKELMSLRFMQLEELIKYKLSDRSS